MLTSRCDEKTGGVPTIHHSATMQECVSGVEKKKRKGKVKIPPNSLLHVASAKHGQQNGTRCNTWKAAIAEIMDEWKVHVLVCINQNDSL